MTGCQFGNVGGLIPCGHEATVELTGMCVHEHLAVARACPRHLVEAREPAALCLPCKEGAHAHKCVMQVIDERPLGFTSDTVDRALDS